MDKLEYIFKVALLGGDNVGKTSILYQYVKNDYMEACKQMIKSDFLRKNEIVDDKEIALQIWDQTDEGLFGGTLKDSLKLFK